METIKNLEEYSCVNGSKLEIITKDDLLKLTVDL